METLDQSKVFPLRRERRHWIQRSLVYRILHLYMESDINSRMQLYCDLVTSLISFQCWQRNWKRAISVYHVGYESEEKKAATSKHCNSGVDGILK